MLPPPPIKEQLIKMMNLTCSLSQEKAHLMRSDKGELKTCVIKPLGM